MADCEQAVKVYINTMSGEDVLLDPPVQNADRIEDLRRRIGSALGVHEKQVVILFQGSEVKNGIDVQKLLEECVDDSVSLTVFKQPCQIRPDEYESYLDRKASAVMKVSEMCYPFGHRVVFPDGQDPYTGNMILFFITFLLFLFVIAVGFTSTKKFELFRASEAMVRQH